MSENEEEKPSAATASGESGQSADSFRTKMREAEQQFKVFLSQVEEMIRDRVGPMPPIIPPKPSATSPIRNARRCKPSEALSIARSTGWIARIVTPTNPTRGSEPKMSQSPRQGTEDTAPEALRQIANSIAHDFNNLLTAIRGYIDLAMGSMDPSTQTHADLFEARTYADRAAALTQQLLAFSRPHQHKPESLILNDIIRNIHPMLTLLLGSEMHMDLALANHLPPVIADRREIEQIVHCLAIYARSAGRQGGTVSISTRSRRDEGRDEVVLVIASDGPGAPMAHDSSATAANRTGYWAKPSAMPGVGIALADMLARRAGAVLQFEKGPGGVGTAILVVFGAPGANVTVRRP